MNIINLKMLILFLGLLLIQSCSGFYALRSSTLQDVNNLPQKASFYLQEKKISNSPMDNVHRLRTSYLQFYYAPWKVEKGSLHSKNTISWPVKELDADELFGPNLRRRTQKWFKTLLARADLENYPSLHKLAITLHTTDLRALPTQEPSFYNPSLAGEGFPFDIFQHSSLGANVPILITHVSTDGGWYLVETADVFGWVPVKDVAFVDKGFVCEFQKDFYIAIVDDETPIQDRKDHFYCQAAIGHIFLLLKETEGSFIVLVATYNENKMAVLRQAVLSKDRAEIFPLPLQQKRIAKLADRLLGK